MSILTSFASASDRIASDPYWVRQFSVAEYHKMVESGILEPGARVELLEGWIVNKMSHNPPHSGTVGRVNRWLGRVLPDQWSLGCQVPITLSDSEPEPDITIARGPEGSFDTRHPGPMDIGILMEIADSSLLTDRRYKGQLYAREGIREFWLIHVAERKIEVFTTPHEGKYTTKSEYGSTDSVPLVLDGVPIAIVAVCDLIAK